MKKFLINYYAVIMQMLFIIYNIFLVSLKVGGMLYKTFMIALICSNIITIIKLRKKIKYKSLVIIVYFLIWLFSKNILQGLFVLSSMLTLIAVGFKESNFIKVIVLLILIFVSVFFVPLYLVYLLIFVVGFDAEKGIYDIYEDTHYYCDNNYEAYVYSGGAWDRAHYSIGKYYEILDVDDIIYITYSERNEKTQQEYEKFIKNHNCNLKGEKYGLN